MRALPKPPEVHSHKHPPQDQFHVPAGTEGIARRIPAYRRHRNALPEMHSVMMTGALREKFPNLASHIGAYVWGRAYALAVDDDGGLRGGAWRAVSDNTL
jgi:hypothetical protein